LGGCSGDPGRRGAGLELSTAKSLGFWGSVASIASFLLSFIPGLYPLGWALLLVGNVLVLAALHGLSKVYGDRGIFWNTLAAIIAELLALILLLALLATVALGLLGVVVGGVGGLVAALGASTAIFMLLTVAVAVSALLWYRALATLSARSGVELFRWSAILYVIGAILLIAGLLLLVVLVGMIILLVAEILDLVR
jgi:uncharacterized membrane protein